MSEDKYHVMPIDDLKEHVDSEGCWCRPQPHTNEDGSITYVHNSLDRREMHEGLGEQ